MLPAAPLDPLALVLPVAPVVSAGVPLLLELLRSADEPLVPDPAELLIPDDVAHAASIKVPEYFCVRASAVLPEEVWPDVELAPL